MDEQVVAAEWQVRPHEDNPPDQPRPPGEDDDDEEEEEDDDEQPPRNADGSLDGGVALPVPPNDTVRRLASECDLVLILECVETLPIAPNHTILQPGVTVSIGLDKNTKLSAVFKRYCDYANEQFPSVTIQPSDLEYIHCSFLNHSDTAESSALMKNDIVRVRKVRVADRQAEAEHRRLQRESDREYYRKFRLLLQDMGGDVLLDCQGNLVDENGLNQKVLRTGVRGHSVLLSKRCKWLGDRIRAARDELARTSVITVTDKEEDDDDGIEGLPYQIEQPNPDNAGDVGVAAAQIENDDDDEPRSPVLASNPHSLLWVPIPNHPPDAVRLLLEYCYTNRVVPLGSEAFNIATNTNRTSNKNLTGPVSPFHNHPSRSRGWPNQGLPTISFAVTLAAIALAEEAKMPRFSLMCQVAASQLVESTNVVEALSMCTAQDLATGNPLARLRKAAMDVVFRNGQRGVVDLCRTPTFRRALEDRSAVVVPSLLIGTMEAISNPEKTMNAAAAATETLRDLSDATRLSFEELDKEDMFHREMERRKRRAERYGEQDGGDGALIHDDDGDAKRLKRVPTTFGIEQHSLAGRFPKLSRRYNTSGSA